MCAWSVRVCVCAYIRLEGQLNLSRMKCFFSRIMSLDFAIMMRLSRTAFPPHLLHFLDSSDRLSGRPIERRQRKKKIKKKTGKRGGTETKATRVSYVTYLYTSPYSGVAWVHLLGVTEIRGDEGGGHRFCYTLKMKCEFTRHWSGENAGGRRIVFYFCPPCLILCRHLSPFFFFFGLCFVWVFYVGGGGIGELSMCILKLRLCLDLSFKLRWRSLPTLAFP